MALKKTNQLLKTLKKQRNQIRKINSSTIAKWLFEDKYFRALIIDLNTQSQLYERGIDANGKILRSYFAQGGQVYSNRTIVLKELKHQPTDRVTLYDSGEFYESFIVKKQGNVFYISARTKKESGDLLDIWGKNILGLSEESKDELRVLSKEIVQKKIRDLLEL